jgi:hypothetical protein
MLSEYINLLVWITVALAASWGLGKLWARSVARWAYLAFSAPGIVVHEMSHWAACKITGARVTDVTLISKEGGSVTHGRPKGGVFGQALVSMAPFFGIPIVIVLLGILFDRFLGCEMEWDLDLSGSVGSVIVGILGSILDLLRVNLVDRKAYWFLIYVYLAASLTVSLSPSAKDFKNGVAGLVVVLVGVLVWILVIARILPDWEYPILSPVVEIMGWVVVVGLIAALFGSLMALPFFLIRTLTRRE